MDIYLYNNTSEKTRVSKTLLNEQKYTGTLRDEASIMSPVFMIEEVNPVGYNYCYIPAFGRYYFIEDITSVRNGLWSLSCMVDVLMSFSDDIRNLSVIVDRSENTQNNNYLVSDVWKTTVRDKTDILNFPSGLSNEGEFILITAGG